MAVFAYAAYSILGLGLIVWAQTSEPLRAPINLWEGLQKNAPSVPQKETVRNPIMEDLCDACNRGDLAKIRALVGEGTNVNGHCYMPIGMTPLTCAAQRGHFDVVQWLLDNAADVNLKDKNGHTPLFAAVRCPTGYGRAEYCMKIIEIVLKRGADPNVPDLLGGTPLMEAQKEGRLDKVKLLIRYGAQK